MNAAEILARAAAVIERNGWNQGGYFADRVGLALRECPVCALGAINIAAGLTPGTTINPRTERAVSLLADRVDPDRALVGTWNDADGRTAEQVVAELRACAATAREVAG